MYPEITLRPVLVSVSANFHLAKMTAGVFMLVIFGHLSKN